MGSKACTRFHKFKVSEVPPDVKWKVRLEKNYHCIQCPPHDLYAKHIDLAYKLLTDNGYQVEKPQGIDNTHVEYHAYIGTKATECIQSHFESHQDNQGATNYNVHTCIIYFENTFKRGGELIIQDGDEGKTIEEIDTRIWNVVLLDGETYHYIVPVNGVGNRRCLVIQMKQSDSTEKSKL
jgi:hypothetical protein